jgi:hypothetical protein
MEPVMFETRDFIAFAIVSFLGGQIGGIVQLRSTKLEEWINEVGGDGSCGGVMSWWWRHELVVAS